jgi:hypothetical protein
VIAASCKPQDAGCKLQEGSEKMEDGREKQKPVRVNPAKGGKIVNSYDAEIKHLSVTTIFDIRYPIYGLLTLNLEHRTLNFEQPLAYVSTTGSSMTNFVPFGTLSSTLIFPWCSRTMEWTIARPRPVPSLSFVK